MNFAQDRMAQALLEDERVGRLIVTNWFRSAPRHVARTLFPRNGARFPTTPRARLHQPIRLRRGDPTSLQAITRAYRAYDQSLERAARRMGLERPAVITMHPLVAGFAPLRWAGDVTFYASDDWAGAAHIYGEYIALYEEAYRRVRESGRRLCAVSQPIVDSIDPSGPAIVVPNGIEPSQWSSFDPAPSWFEQLPGPRLLYVGTLDERLDVGLLSRAAAALSHGSLVLVGRLTNPEHLESLQATANVHLRERVAHRDVPGLIHGADACMIPHASTQLTRAMSPLKLYEYLAAGRPVVSVDLPPIRGFGPRVVLAGEGDDFGAAALEAIRRGPAPESERAAFVRANAWSGRHETILDFALGDPMHRLEHRQVEV